MVKSSSLAAMITVPNLFQNAKIIGGREYDYMSMYILIAFIYWVLSLSQYLELFNISTAYIHIIMI